MRFGSVNSCSNPSNPNRFFVFGILGTLFFAGNSYGATSISSVPQNGGSESKNGSLSQYFFVRTSSFDGVPTLPAFITFTPLKVNSDLFELWFFSNANPTLTSGQQAAVTIQAYPLPTGATTTVFAPIASVNGQACNDQICQGRSTYNGVVRYYAAKFPIGGGVNGSSIRVGFYPDQICDEYHTKAGGVAQGCNDSTPFTVKEPLVNTPTTMSLLFSLYVLADTNPLTAPTGSPTDKMPTPLSLVMTRDSPSLNCPPDLNNIYIPQDGQILVNQSAFSLSGTTSPPVNMWVVAKDTGVKPGASPDTSASFSTTSLTDPAYNSIAPRTDFKGSLAEPFSGFANSTDLESHPYNISFVIQDAAGVYAPAPASCSLSNVQTSAIQTALDKSSCFIATAAFASADSGPVQMLRMFRDQFLVGNQLGDAFVSWYYNWSPPVARWVLNHPVFRLPILLFLTPIEVFAWLILNPFGLVLFLFSSGLASVYLVSLWMTQKEEGKIDEA